MIKKKVVDNLIGMIYNSYKIINNRRKLKMNKKLFCKMLAELLMYGSTLKTFKDVVLLVESKGFKIRKNKK